MLHRIDHFLTLLTPLTSVYWTGIALGIVGLCALPRVGRMFGHVGRRLAEVGRHPALAVVLVFIVSLGICIGWTKVVGVPAPNVHDEFSYLLAADTFAHGRLSNPTPALWEHFETFHVIFTPTYASKYPPGQGLFLAFGQKFFGLPIVGAWLATAIACAAAMWALLAWVRPKWAVLGAILLLINPQIIEWSQNYWGGSVAMLGGALVLGAVRRIIDRQRVRDSILLGIGAVILANSRPWEGLVLFVALSGILAAWLCRWGPRTGPKPRPQSRIIVRRIVAPAGAILLIGTVMMGYYNWRVTGNPLRLPYVVHAAQYDAQPPLLFFKPRPAPHYRFPELEDYHLRVDREMYDSQRSLKGAGYGMMRKVTQLSHSFLRDSALALGLLCVAPAAMGGGWTAALVVAGLVYTAGLFADIWMFPHYAAPGIALLFLILMIGMRHLRAWQRNHGRLGEVLVRATVVLCLCSYAHGWNEVANRPDPYFGTPRAELMALLNRGPERHLIIVRYAPGHSSSMEWVQNGADINGEKVIWARDMGAEENEKLIAQYPGRKTWLLVVGDHAEPLRPYVSNAGIKSATRGQG